ncbi:uncharacterized protein LOC134257277 [Saccostrea cucullata]|uniref:uncharacterized protein LOC134257277 n=1 Tax=Saccostrea cuccullata TaxID=36930 RepID=UPI002ED189B7
MHQLVLIAAGSIGVTSAIWIILGFLCKRYICRDANGKGNRNAEEHGHTGYSFMELLYIEPDNQLPTTSTDFRRMERNTRPSTKSQQISRRKLRRSQSLLDGNSRCDRYSDDYNHLDFHKKFKSPQRLNTNENYSKLDIMAPHRCANTNHEDFEEESSYVSLVLEDTLLVSGSNSIQIGQGKMDKQRELDCIKTENESISNEDQSNADLPTYTNIDETCSDTSNSKIDIQRESLDSAYCNLELNEKD